MKRFRNVSAIVTLLAGFITAVVMIINRYSLVSFLWILIGVMVCFYAVSRIICFIVSRISGSLTASSSIATVIFSLVSRRTTIA